MIGQTLSHYEILDQLGAGGMGIVYRAQDTKLAREVAVKVLPEGFTKDPQSLARFEREAHLLASLNHPNIATIHGLEDVDGVHFLVLEYVPGPTLAERIASGPIPLEEALALAQQIAEGIEAAHEKGVIHRDLKPANIKITPEGKVKVLDFGLAMPMREKEAAKHLSESPTLTRGTTDAGLLLGTARYMSPEQARGKPVDKRADIWAFGVVLHEMLTARALFDGETLTDVLAAVVVRTPDWSTLPAETPPPVRHLLRRCLVHDTKRRLRDIGEARVVIEDALAQPATPEATGDRPAVPGRARPWRSALWAAASFLLVVLAFLAGWLGHREPGAL